MTTPAPLNRVIVFVADVERCAAFYVETFGFKRLKTEDPADSWAELETGGCRLAFHKARGVSEPTGSPDNPHKLVFYSSDPAAMRERLIAKGVRMKPLQTYGSLTFCDGTDVEGHVFQISNRP